MALDRYLGHRYFRYFFPAISRYLDKRVRGGVILYFVIKLRHLFTNRSGLMRGSYCHAKILRSNVTLYLAR